MTAREVQMVIVNKWFQIKPNPLRKKYLLISLKLSCKTTQVQVHQYKKSLMALSKEEHTLSKMEIRSKNKAAMFQDFMNTAKMNWLFLTKHMSSNLDLQILTKLKLSLSI